jgi:NAD-dependent deacetylase
MDEISIAREAIAASSRLFVLTGAGVSAESGVPTFRGGGGSLVWRGMPFEVLSSAQMAENDLPLLWEWFDYRLRAVGECSPNPAHIALADAERSGRFEELAIATQNIDGLHSAAGSANVLELHGGIHRARCIDCGFIADIRELPADERPPVCVGCEGMMRPDVVLFGEMMPMVPLERAMAAAATCDACLLVGTTAVVYPANTLPEIAKRNGAKVIEVNPETTVATGACDISIRGKAGEVLPQLF